MELKIFQKKLVMVFYDNEPDGKHSERFIQYLKNYIIILKRALIDFEKCLDTIKGIDKMKKWYNYGEKDDISFLTLKTKIKNESKELMNKKKKEIREKLKPLNTIKYELLVKFLGTDNNIKRRKFWKKMFKITDEIDNYIEDLIDNYDENTNEYKREYLIKELYGISTYHDLLGYLNGWYWLLAGCKEKEDLVNYLDDKFYIFKQYFFSYCIIINGYR